jgi:DNA repair protein RadC
MGYNISIKDMPEEMRPREKLIARGEGSLTESELLAIVLGQGTRNLSALDLADRLLVDYKGLGRLSEASLEELTCHKGIGLAKAVGIKAALELGRRASLPKQIKNYIKSPTDVNDLLVHEMRGYDRSILGFYTWTARAG